MAGLLTGTPVPAGARYAVIFKSPQTGGYGEPTAGGHEFCLGGKASAGEEVIQNSPDCFRKEMADS